VHHDPEKYYALIERIRREADAFREMFDADDPKPSPSSVSASVSMPPATSDSPSRVPSSVA
jgi:hypothetical protein